jgi:hypothetical protein
MNKGVLTIGIILLSVLALVLVNVLTNYSTGSELDYYLVKETTDSAIEDAIDMYYLRTCGVYRLDKEKFVESFLYRFADSVDSTRDYKIGFYDINEVPPKVSVKVDSLTAIAFTTKDNTGKDKDISGNISTSYDAILETNYITDMAVEEGLQDKNEDACKALKLS